MALTTMCAPRVRVVNTLIRLLGATAWFTPLDVDALVKKARKRTGLSDFGEDDWQEPLALLVGELRNNPSLTQLGGIMAGRILQGLLENRLRTWHAWQAASTASPRDPLIILGLPRTGSTLLHEHLAEHQDLRAPLYWESERLPDRTWRDQIRQCHSGLHAGLINFLAPDFRWIHRVAARRPHECVTIQALSFRSMQFHALLHLPAYTRWLADCDWIPAYRWHSRYLSLLQQSDLTQRWVLKAPGHMHGIRALLDTYPDARFVQLHREAEACIPSMASLYATLRATTEQTVDLGALGQHICTEWQEGLHRVREIRRSPEINSRFLDVHYTDLVADPTGTAAAICDFAGLSYDTRSASAMRHYLDKNRATKRHTYTLEQFGLDQQHVENSFGAG